MNRDLEFKRRDDIHKGWVISKKYANITPKITSI